MFFTAEQYQVTLYKSVDFIEISMKNSKNLDIYDIKLDKEHFFSHPTLKHYFQSIDSFYNQISLMENKVRVSEEGDLIISINWGISGKKDLIIKSKQRNTSVDEKMHLALSQLQQAKKQIKKLNQKIQNDKQHKINNKDIQMIKFVPSQKHASNKRANWLTNQGNLILKFYYEKSLPFLSQQPFINGKVSRITFRCLKVQEDILYGIATAALINSCAVYGNHCMIMSKNGKRHYARKFIVVGEDLYVMQQVSIEVDLISDKVSWLLNGVYIYTQNLPAQFKDTNIFPIIVAIQNEEKKNGFEVQFIHN